MNTETRPAGWTECLRFHGLCLFDAVSANKVVIITDCLVDFPVRPSVISQQYVDM